MPDSIVAMLHVADLQRSERFYTSLGFSVVRSNRDFDPTAESVNWILLDREGSRLMLNAGGTLDLDRRDVTLSITVDDVDGMFADLPEGVNVVYEPRDQFYGRRDFQVRDPSGFSLLFGQPLARS